MLQGVGKFISLSMTLAAVLFFAAQPARAQGEASEDTASASTPSSTANDAKTVESAQSVAAPAFVGYKGVKVGMGADEVRQLLGDPKEKSKALDFFVFSERENAQVIYDEEGKVSAIAVTYYGKKVGAPEPTAILGKEVAARDDGSLYHRETYAAAGYWVSYSRTAGDEPIVIVTMQKMR